MTRTAITMSEHASGVSTRCEDLFGRCDRRVEIVRSSIEDEGLAVHQRFRPQPRGDA